MLRLAVSDLRASWLSWAGVSLTFVAATFTLTLAALIAASGLAARAAGTLADEFVSLVLADAAINIVFCSIVSLSIVGASTGLVVAARRGSIARLLLGGASPTQVTGMVLAQVTLVVLACAVLGSLLAVVLTQPALDLIADDRGFTAPDAVVSLPAILAATLGTVLVAVVGAAWQARGASRIPPVEALRASRGDAPARNRWFVVGLRWVGFVVLMAAVVAGPAIFRAVGEELEEDAFTILMQISFFSLFLTGAALTLVARHVVGPVTRAWSALVPVPSPAWRLARHSVAARGERLSRSVVPVMFAVGLAFGLLSFGQTLNATLDSIGLPTLDGSSMETLLALFALPLVVAVAGSVGSLVMMSRQRDAELALDGVIGATPGQQASIPVLEALLVVVTASLMGLLMAGACIGTLAYGLELLVDEPVVVIPWATLGWVALIGFVVTAAAALLPTLPSLRQPAPRVIARLVAD